MQKEQRGAADVSSWHAFPAILSRGDLVLLMILIVVHFRVNGILSTSPLSFVYLLVGLLTFLVPCAIVTHWLAQRHPGECAPYLWVKRIAGPNWSSLSAFCIWLPGVLVLVPVIDDGLLFISSLTPGWFITPLEQCIGIICFLSVAAALACIPLRWLKNALATTALLYLGMCVFLGATGLWKLISGHSAVLAPHASTLWQGGAGSSIYSIVLLALIGVDIPLLMSAEVSGGADGVRKASNYVWLGCALVLLAYTSGTLGMLLIGHGPRAGISSTAPGEATLATLGLLSGRLLTIVLIASQLAITIAYILTFARVSVFVARDRHLPASLGTINAQGVPVRSTLLQAAIVAAVSICIFAAGPALFGPLMSHEAMSRVLSAVLQAGTAVVWVSSIIQLFILTLIQLYRSRRYSAGEKGWRRFSSLAMAAVCLLGICAALAGIWGTISRSWVPGLIPDHWWILLVCGVAAAAFLCGWLFGAWPRMRALFSAQRSVNSREWKLREELLDSSKEQQLLVEQQQILLAEVSRLYHEQSQAAVTDAVTGLPNHRAIMSRLGEEIANTQRAQGSCAILFVDIDDFKLVNDTWGHRAGDAILREVGARLRVTLREEDFVGRYGGEEFAVILGDSELIGARHTAERLRQGVAATPCRWMVEDSQIIIPITVTVSIGIAVYGLHGLTREELVEYADRGMYQAKRSGRDCISIADVPYAAARGRRPGKPRVERERQQTREDLPPEYAVPAQAVQALIAVAEAHDPGVNDHSHRMVKLARIMARKLNLPASELPLLYLTALLHDIGKIGIPTSILHKPGPLSNEEWLVMQRHPEIGRQILVQTGGIFQQVAGSIVAHHERWDGYGYPRQLTREAIPLSARIVSVIDAFETMTARRPYHEPFTVEEAQDELQRCAGSQFDPGVVEAFLEVISELKGQKRQAALTGTPSPADLKTIEGESIPGQSKRTRPLDRASYYAKSRSR
jgi:diguanylate cyclase (GGDEF)-like protein